jgi:prophage regulatory protein
MAEQLRKILRKKRVCGPNGCTGLSESAIYRLEKQGEFPKRIQLGGNSVGWFEDEVIAWQRSRERGMVPESKTAAATEASVTARAAKTAMLAIVITAAMLCDASWSLTVNHGRVYFDYTVLENTSHSGSPHPTAADFFCPQNLQSDLCRVGTNTRLERGICSRSMWRFHHPAPCISRMSIFEKTHRSSIMGHNTHQAPDSAASKYAVIPIPSLNHGHLNDRKPVDVSVISIALHQLRSFLEIIEEQVEAGAAANARSEGRFYALLNAARQNLDQADSLVTDNYGEKTRLIFELDTHLTANDAESARVVFLKLFGEPDQVS